MKDDINVEGSKANKKYIAFFSLFTLIPSILISVFSLFLFSFALEKYFDKKITTAVNNSYEVAKNYVQDVRNKIESDMPAVWKCLQYFNSRPFLLFLEKLTGIKDLIADVDFEGGGIHKIKNGGRLELHSDYNKHPNKDIWRRINLLLYLTPNWDYNGHLDLYEKEPLVKVKSILPTFNRAVIFNTTDDSIHGHPIPLVCPDEVSRYSFALYYFTKDRPEHEKSDSKAAIWYKTSYL